MVLFGDTAHDRGDSIFILPALHDQRMDDNRMRLPLSV